MGTSLYFINLFAIGLTGNLIPTVSCPAKILVLNKFKFAFNTIVSGPGQKFFINKLNIGSISLFIIIIFLRFVPEFEGKILFEGFSNPIIMIFQK